MRTVTFGVAVALALAEVDADAVGDAAGVAVAGVEPDAEVVEAVEGEDAVDGDAVAVAVAFEQPPTTAAAPAAPTVAKTVRRDVEWVPELARMMPDPRRDAVSRLRPPMVRTPAGPAARTGGVGRRLGCSWGRTRADRLTCWR